MRYRIPHSRPSISTHEISAVTRVLRQGRLSTGEAVVAFEKNLARITKTREAVATSSGSASLHLALLAIGVQPGDEVIIPSYTCAALLNAVHYVRAHPQISDVDPCTGQMDPGSAKKLLTRKTRAIIIPYLYGMPFDITSLLALRIPVIEDISQALGASFCARPVGSFGILSVVSSYATKMIATGHGGAVLGSDPKKLAKVRDLITYDNRNDYKIRYNYRLSDMAAAVGVAQLKRLRSLILARRARARLYNRLLRDSPLELPYPSQPTGAVFYRYIIRTKSKISSLVKYLARSGIEVKQPVYRPLHRYLGLSKKQYPGTEEAHRSILSLPIYPDLPLSAIRQIAHKLISKTSAR